MHVSWGLILVSSWANLLSLPSPASPSPAPTETPAPSQNLLPSPTLAFFRSKSSLMLGCPLTLMYIASFSPILLASGLKKATVQSCLLPYAVFSTSFYPLAKYGVFSPLLYSTCGSSSSPCFCGNGTKIWGPHSWTE